jgi:hypothetical protein
MLLYPLIRLHGAVFFTQTLTNKFGNAVENKGEHEQYKCGQEQHAVM